MVEIEEIQDDNDEVCAVCNNSAKQKCSACKEVYYCSREHQKLHWKAHAKKCRAFKLAEDTKVGRHYVTTRKIEVGELVLQENTPLVAGPHQGTPPVCLNCYVVLDATSAKPCDKCGWPLCQNCIKHGDECEFTMKYRKSKVSITEYGFPHPTYEAVGVIRVLALKYTNPEAYRKLLKLKDHCVEAAKQSKAFDAPNDVAGFVKRFFKVDDVSEKEITKISGILMVLFSSGLISRDCSQINATHLTLDAWNLHKSLFYKINILNSTDFSTPQNFT